MMRRVEQRREARRERRAAVRRTAAPVVALVLQSRIGLVFLLQVAANALLPDHDADAFKSLPVAPASRLDSALYFLLSGFARWDAVHFLHIAQYGYTYETNLAFFPLFPVLVRMVTGLWFPILPSGWLQPYYALLLTASVMNLGAYLASAYLLYQVTLNYLRDPGQALLSVVLFALNPASIFFSAAYSESFFSMFTLLGLEVVSGGPGGVGAGRALMASAAFGLALLSRANGLLNLGFLLFVLGGPWLLALFSRHSPSRYSTLLSLPLVGLASLLLFATPYVYHQWAIFTDFCSPTPKYLPRSLQLLGRENDMVMGGDLTRLPWCQRLIPISYAYIQAQYWDVGFLGYFQLRKLPLFIIASPTLVIATFACYDGLKRSCSEPLAQILENKRSLLPLSLHLLLLTITGCFFANVEVTTRILFSSSPLLYWFIVSHWRLGDESKDSASLLTLARSVWESSPPTGRALLAYSVFYMTLGTILHVNFLPWT